MQLKAIATLAIAGLAVAALMIKSGVTLSITVTTAESAKAPTLRQRNVAGADAVGRYSNITDDIFPPGVPSEQGGAGARATRSAGQPPAAADPGVRGQNFSSQTGTGTRPAGAPAPAGATPQGLPEAEIVQPAAAALPRAPVDASLYIFNEMSQDPAYLSQAWPSVVVLGVQKGGTTSLSKIIMQHTGICPSKRGKETHFLDGKGTGKRADYPRLYGGIKSCSRRATKSDIPTARTVHPILGGRVHVQGRHFEGTPKYFDFPGMAQKFFTAVPKALHQQLKFVVVLREPVSRDLSAYNHMRGSKQYHWVCPETLPHLKRPNTYSSYAATFRRCWSPRGLEEGRQGSCKRCMKIVAERGRYHQHLRRWFRLFGRERFLVLESSMVWEKSPPEVVRDTLERVGRFLGLSGDEWSRLTKYGLPKVNSAEGKTQYKKGKDDKFRLHDLGQSLCQEMARYYRGANQELYNLMRTTKPKAPREQPDFPEFPDPCSGFQEMAANALKGATRDPASVEAGRGSAASPQLGMGRNVTLTASSQIKGRRRRWKKKRRGGGGGGGGGRVL